MPWKSTAIVPMGMNWHVNSILAVGQDQRIVGNSPKLCESITPTGGFHRQKRHISQGRVISGRGIIFSGSYRLSC